MSSKGIIDSGSELSAQDFLLFDDGSILGLNSRQVAALAVAITWVPLIALSAVQGLAWGHTWGRSALLDPGIVVRYLVALPILIITPRYCSHIIDEAARHFLRAGLVKGADLDRFRTIIYPGMKVRKSHAAEWNCLGLAYACTALFLALIVWEKAYSWRSVGSNGHHSLSLAGWWFIAVSQPVYLFVLMRFLYRMALWWRFLWRTSRLDLQLHAVHPDGAGGLGFLGLTLNAFRLPAFGISAALAGGVANVVLLNGVPASELRWAAVIVVLLVVGLFVGPLPFFYRRVLSETRDRDVMSYWVLAGAQMDELKRKWTSPGLEPTKTLDGPDFSEAMGLSSMLERAQKMTLLPFQLNDVLFLTGAVLLPFLPVVAMKIPLSEIFRTILEILK